MENLSHDSEQDYLSEGITAELIARLGQNRAIRVISRTSVTQYKAVHRSLPQIAKELGVNAVLEGTVARLGDHVQMTAQLVRTDPERVLWSQSFERSLNDVRPLEEEITSEVANQIKINVLPERTTEKRKIQPVSWEAYEAYLRGISQQRSVNGKYRKIEYFKQAIEKQPDYAAAYAEIALAYVGLGHEVALPPQEAFPRAKTAALKALELDADLREAHSALGDVLFLYDWDFVSAEKEYQKSIELNPNGLTARATYTSFLNAMGRPDEAIAEAKRIDRIDPIWYATNSMGIAFYWARRYDEAIALLRKQVELDRTSANGHYSSGYRTYRNNSLVRASPKFKKHGTSTMNRPRSVFWRMPLRRQGTKPQPSEH